jgi:hypothetical protein
MEKLNVNDKVFIENALSKRLTIRVVKSISTKRKDITIDNGQVFEPYGIEKGSNWYKDRIFVYTPELEQKYLRQNQIYVLETVLKSLSILSDDELKSIYDIVKPRYDELKKKTA